MSTTLHLVRYKTLPSGPIREKELDAVSKKAVRRAMRLFYPHCRVLRVWSPEERNHRSTP